MNILTKTSHTAGTACILLIFFISQFVCQAQKQFPAAGFYQEVKYEDNKGKILIPVTINDKTYKFIFDTGGLLVISSAVRDADSFVIVGDKRVNGINKISKRFDQVRIANTQIRELSFRNFNAIHLDLFDRPPGSCINADGLIGRDFLKNMIVQINSKTKTIIFTDDHSKVDLKNTQETKMFVDKNGKSTPYLKVKINGKHKVKAQFDSGSSKLFSFGTKHVEKLISKKKFNQADIKIKHGIEAIGAAGVIPERDQSYQVRLDKLEMGNIAFTDFYTDASLASDARIGTGILEYGIVTLDYQNKRFHFEPFEIETVVEKSPSYGFSIFYHEGKMFVSNVTQDSEAMLKGIKLDQQILSIDGVKMADITDENVCDFMFSKYHKEPTRTVQFLDKDGTVKEVTVALIRI